MAPFPPLAGNNLAEAVPVFFSQIFYLLLFLALHRHTVASRTIQDNGLRFRRVGHGSWLERKVAPVHAGLNKPTFEMKQRLGPRVWPESVWSRVTGETRRGGGAR